MNITIFSGINMLFTIILLLACSLQSLKCFANTRHLKFVHIHCLGNMVAWNVMFSLLHSCLHLCLFSPHLHSQMATVSLEQHVKSACGGLAEGGRWCSIWLLFLRECEVSLNFKSNTFLPTFLNLKKKKNESRLVRSHCCSCVCVFSFLLPINF
jgi:hypothetical protein